MNDYIKSKFQQIKIPILINNNNNIFDNRNYQEIKCSFFSALIKIVIVQPFDFLRFRIQSSEFPVSIKNMTLSLINKEGFKTFFLGIPATSFGVLFNSLIQFTLYQKFQKILLLYEFDEEVSKSINNLELFKLMEITHNSSSKKKEEEKESKYNININELDNNNNKYDNNYDNDYDSNIISKTDFINKIKRSEKLNTIKFHSEIKINNLKDKDIKDINQFNNDSNNDKNKRKYDIIRKYIKFNEHETHCYELYLNKIVKICGISGFLSGIGLAIFTTPIDTVRIKMQSVQNIQKLETKSYINNSTINCIKNSYKDFGIKGFYKAFNLNLLREGIASTIYFSSFEYLKNREKIKLKKENIEFYKTFIYGAISGALLWLITFPIDTVKTKIISDSIIKNSNRYKGIIDCIKKNYKKNGFLSFYSGFSVVFFRGLIVNGIVLSSFDYCRKTLIIND
jgi:solute carrier family 25 carnitine/acylcarnitine transporter 20/29